MLSILLPLYQQSPRDMAGVQWRPIRAKTKEFMTAPDFIETFFDSPSDECWLLDSVLLISRGATETIGPPLHATVFPRDLILAFRDISDIPFPGNLISTLMFQTADDVFGQVVDIGTSKFKPGNLFVAPSTRLHYRQFFLSGTPGQQAFNPDASIEFYINGIAIPRGNISQ